MIKKLLFFGFIILLNTSVLAQFVENKGQVLDREQNLKPEVKFYYETNNTALYFLHNKVVYSFTKIDSIDETKYINNVKGLDSAKLKRGATFNRMDMVFLNSNEGIQIEKGEKEKGDIHFYLNKRNGIRDVSSYKTITYKNLYKNIDLVFYQLPKGLKYDFILHKDANIEDIKIQYLGAENLSLDNGKLVIKTAHQTLVEKIPLSFINDDRTQEVEVNYNLDDKGILSFKTKTNKYLSLTIDPVLEWATYFNGTAATTDALDYSSNHLDANGNFYIYGQVYSAAGNYPITNPGIPAYVSNYNNNADLYIAQFNSNRTLIWSTYLGGSDGDNIYGAHNIESRGNELHIVGEAISAGAPFTNGGGFYNTTVNKPFWARFNITNGALLHLTSISGGYSPSIAISSAGSVAIIMESYNFNSPIVVNRAGAYNQATNGGFKDVFLSLFNASYTQIWGTYLGGPGTQENFMCTFDNSNNLFFVGETQWLSGSTIANERLVNLPGAYYKSTVGGGTDVMLGKFNASGALVWNTLFGGNNSDARRGQQGGYAKILLHPTTQELVMVFNTTSTDLTTVNLAGAYYKTVPTHPSFAGSSGSFWNYAAYIAKFSTAGALNYATYWYNSTDGDLIFDATFGACNKLYIAGRTDYLTATSIPLSGGFNLPNGQQTFVMQMNSSTYAAEWSSFMALNTSYNPAAAGRSDNPRVYFSAKGYYDNGPTVNPAGSAYYQANNINGTSSNYMIWQIHPTLPPNITGTNLLCEGQTTTLTASGSVGAPYEWYNSLTGGSSIFTGAVFTSTALATNTTLYASSGTGLCISPRAAFTVTVNPAPTISIGSITSNTICSGQAVTITPSGGSASNYTIFPGGTSGSSFLVSPTSTTTYTIRGANASGCVSSASSDLVTTITVNTTPNITTSGATSATICSGQSFVVTPSGGGTGSYTLTNTGATSSTNFVLSPTASTNYTIIGANSNGCVSNTSTDLNINITVNATPTITTTGATAVTICSGASYTITPSGGVGSYTLVNTGATSGTNFIVTPNTTTTYSVIGASANGCISSTSSDLNVVLTVNSTPTVNATFSSNALCSSQNVTITLAGASGTYTLLPGSLTSTSSFVVSPPAGTTVYTVIANNTNGCVSTLSSQIYTTSVSVVTNPTITASFITNTICAGSTATITPFGANTFTLLPNNISVASGGSFTLTPTVATTYTINGTATGGCVSVPSTQFVTTIGVSTTPTVSLSSVSPSAVLCSGQSATLTVTGAVAGTYTILNTGSSSSPLVVTPLTTTTYTIVGAATNGCVSNALTDLETTITVNQSPTLSVSSQQNVLCFGNATGSVNVSSSGGTGTTTITPLTTTNLSAGTYTYVTTDALGCSSSSVITITEPTSAVAVLAATPTASNSNCVVFNGSASVSSTGGTGSVTVSWNGGAQTGTSVTGLNTGINTFTLTDANGCTNSANTGTINIDGVLGILTTAVSQSSVNCKGELTGAVTFTTSGVGPNSYTLTNTLTNTSITNATGIFTGLSAGNYSVYVLGNGGCVDTQALTIAEPSASVSLVGGAVTSNTVSCFGGNAIITATATGGLGNFTYVWGANTSTVSTASYPVGTYTMMVIDGNNCGLSNVQSFTVTQPTSSVTISSVANTTLACNGGTTTVTAIVTGGSGNYNYQWQAPSTSTTNTATYTAGVYTMSATDGNGCASVTHTVIVTQPTNALTVSQVTLVSSCPNQNSGSVEIVATGGTPLYTVLWSNNATTFLVTNLPEGSISAIVTDASGCVSNYSTTIITENCIKISVPTFFSPNGDGKNDFLVINAATEFPNNKLEIFNRWGSLVYSKTPYNDTFDGKANVSSVVGSGMLPAGTYYIIFDFGDGETPVYKSYLELKW